MYKENLIRIRDKKPKKEKINKESLINEGVIIECSLLDNNSCNLGIP